MGIINLFIYLKPNIHFNICKEFLNLSSSYHALPVTVAMWLYMHSELKSAADKNQDIPLLVKF